VNLSAERQVADTARGLPVRLRPGPCPHLLIPVMPRGGRRSEDGTPEAVQARLDSRTAVSERMMNSETALRVGSDAGQAGQP
jgi:hypothetical protein